MQATTSTYKNRENFYLSSKKSVLNVRKCVYYVLDATGNVMSVYERVIDNTAQTVTFEQTEKYIYGSSHLGVLNSNINLLGSAGTAPYTQTIFSHQIGKRHYSLSNHKNDVLSVISDKVLPHSSNGTTVDYYLADIIQSTDYSGFGVQLSGRNFVKSGAKEFAYGFQGQLEDDELKNEGNSINYKYRMHDPRLGRFFAIDPLSTSYPWNSPYAFSENRVIDAIELEGLETFKISDNQNGGKALTLIDVTTEKIILDENNKVCKDFKYCEIIKAMNGYTWEVNTTGWSADPTTNQTKTLFIPSIGRGYNQPDQNNKTLNTFALNFASVSQGKSRIVPGGLVGELDLETAKEEMADFRGNGFVGNIPMEPIDRMTVFLPNKELKDEFLKQWASDLELNAEFPAEKIEFLDKPDPNAKSIETDEYKYTEPSLETGIQVNYYVKTCD